MFQEILERLAKELDARSIPYMVIGGQAVLLYGEPRLTRDIDVTLGVDVRSLPLVAEAVAAMRLLPRVADAETFVRRTMVLPCEEEESGIRVDFIFSFSPYERQAIQRAGQVHLGSRTVRFASVEDLVVHKIIAGRPRDLEDVRTVLVKNPDADTDYIRRWLHEFEEELAEPLVQRFETLWEDTRTKDESE